MWIDTNIIEYAKLQILNPHGDSGTRVAIYEAIMTTSSDNMYKW
jgi:hypothetical protein